jgi:cGMP-dependent protein kinase
MLLGPLEELKKRGKEGTAVVAKAKGAGSTAPQKHRLGSILRRDLKRLGLLGCGGFGAVEMVEHRETKEVYALKALSKGFVLKCGMEKCVMSEKDVQMMCNSEFIVKLYETFNSVQSLYFLLELALGGEIYATYNKKGLWGNVKCAKFYVAGTVLAFEHLHRLKIIFRDLKPENLLLTDKGNVKLTDMGLAKVVVGKTFTTCGTPDYFAPELIASKGHTAAVDWWCLGILTFELLAGHPPFESASPMQIYQKVAKGINKMPFPNTCSDVAGTLIKSLCESNPSERLPMKKEGVANIKNNDWFKGFDWGAMENLKMEAPYKPPIKNKKDISNFSARKEDMPPQIVYKDPGTKWDRDFATSS